MKEFAEALRTGHLKNNLFMESPDFAFNEEPPKNFEERIRKSVICAEQYRFDAIPVSQRFNNEYMSLTYFLEILSKVNTKVSFGAVYSAPFTRTAKENGIENTLLDFSDNGGVIQKLDERTEKLAAHIKKLEGYVDFIILIDPLACNDIVSPSFFEQHILGTYRKITNSTSLPVIAHMPGKIIGNFPFIIYSGIKAVQPIDKDNLREAISSSMGKVQIIGNIKNGLLIDGGYEEIERDFERCRQAHNFNSFIVHTDFWIPKSADPNRVNYLSSLIR